MQVYGQKQQFTTISTINQERISVQKRPRYIFLGSRRSLSQLYSEKGSHIVFIADAAKDTKGAHIDIISAYLSKNGSLYWIDLQAAVGLDATGPGTVSAERKAAIGCIFRNDCFSDLSEHYLDYSDYKIDDNDDDIEQ